METENDNENENKNVFLTPLVYFVCGAISTERTFTPGYYNIIIDRPHRP
jgi:hypothetical protein